MAKILDPKDYTIAWIAVLDIEAEAALNILTPHRGRFEYQPGDDYVYIGGELGNYNVVLATLPEGQNYGAGAAAALVNQVKTRFRNIWFALLVGVAAGLPNIAVPPSSPKYRDIRLGDVLVCVPDKTSTGILHYDLGKDTKSGFEIVSRQAETPSIVRAAFRNIRLTERSPFRENNTFDTYLKEFMSKANTEKFKCRAQYEDQLHEYVQDHDEVITLLCERDDREEVERTLVWYGNIGSGNSLMRNPTRRDALRDEHDLIGLEMEAAGIMNSLPTGVIRGVCDYGDEFKNKDWQPYAAAVAAVYARGVLETIPPVSEGQGQQAKVQQRFSTLPSSLTPHFIGREHYFSDIEAKFRSSAPADQRVVLWGLEGTGKTQIALKYAHSCTTSMSTFWISSRSFSTFATGMKQIYLALGAEKQTGDAQGSLLEELVVLLDQKAGEWLMVIDGADDKSLLLEQRNALPPISKLIPRSKRGRILVTTTDSRLVGINDGVIAPAQNGIRVSPFSTTEGMQFVSKSIPTHFHPELELDNSPLLEHLVNLLDCFPIALSHAASQMYEDSIPLSDFIQSYTAMRDSLDLDDVELAYRSGFVTFELSYQRLLSASSAGNVGKPPEAKILDLISCFDGRQIPKNNLKEIYDNEFGSLKFNSFPTTIGRLRNLCLVEYSKDSNAYWCLSLVQHWTYHRLCENERTYYKAMATSALRRLATRTQSRLMFNYSNTLTAQHQIVTESITRYYTWDESPYEKTQTLGQGAFGRVYQVSRRMTSGAEESYACKSIPLIKALDHRFRADFYINELKALRLLRHRHIIRLVESFFVSEKQISLVLDPIGDIDLFAYFKSLRGQNYISSSQIRMIQTWFGCLIEGLDYIHSQGVSNIDVKPQNIILKAGEVIYIDFNTALIDEGETNDDDVVDDYAFTQRYAAPEIKAYVKPRQRFVPKADVYGLGCVYLELLMAILAENEVDHESVANHVVDDTGVVTADFDSLEFETTQSIQQGQDFRALRTREFGWIDQDDRAYRLHLIWYLHTKYTTPAARQFPSNEPNVNPDQVNYQELVKSVTEWCYLMLQPLPQNRSSSEEMVQRISLTRPQFFCQHCERRLAPHQRFLPSVHMVPAPDYKGILERKYNLTWEEANAQWASDFKFDSGVIKGYTS